ncbi:flavin reductase family protein [Actinomycetospora rhizophila]|uniref:Flavin reductase family protein n=1 Tax=Actinomycetospora rhizophila TaxID=1416876 RepID=A0ABV9ZJR0_9PSEU
MAGAPTNRGAPVDTRAMRAAMGGFATGVAVVTTRHDGVPHGMTVNSLTSVSLDPPLLLVCLTTGARTTDAVLSAGRFVVNVLAARQEHIALRFARRGEEHFAGLDVSRSGPHDLPVVPGALVHAECAVDRSTTAGDHVVVFGRVDSLCRTDATPLAFHGGRFADLRPHGEELDLWFA